MAIGFTNCNIQGLGTLLLVKLLLLMAVFLTIRGWNPATLGPSDIEEVKVVNDQHTPQTGGDHDDLLPVEKKDKK